MAKKKKKGHARGKKRRGNSLRKRYGHSEGLGGSIRMNVSGQLVLDPEALAEVIETAVEAAVDEVVPDVVAEAVEESVPEAVAEATDDAYDAPYYG
jgi:hypothetical protein